MRKILAIICTLVTLYAFKETFIIFTSKDAEIIAQRPILIVIALSICLPLILLCIWLWRPKNKNIEN
jgi:phosphoglycerol transferase MdoB-like AlkP superfamily enzyme